MTLNEFHQDASFGGPIAPINGLWADEDFDIPPPADLHTMNLSGAAPSFGRPEPPIPDEPPYTAWLGSMSLTVTEDHIKEAFKDLPIESIRLTMDRLTGKPRGSGFVTFATRDGLIQAVARNNIMIDGRSTRVGVAEQREETPRFSRFGVGGGASWRRTEPVEDRELDVADILGRERPQQRRSGSGPFGGNRLDFSSAREGRAPPPLERQPNISDRPERSFSGNRMDFAAARQSDVPTFENQPSFADRPERQERRPRQSDMSDRSLNFASARNAPAAETERRSVTPEGASRPWRHGAGNRGSSPFADGEDSRRSRQPSSRIPSGLFASAEWRKPEAGADTGETSHESAGTVTQLSGNPFGAAKPVDTAAKLKELEEKAKEEASKAAHATTEVKSSKPKEFKQYKGGKSDNNEKKNSVAEVAGKFAQLRMQKEQQSEEDIGSDSEWTEVTKAKK
ncbi:hypothetical protein CANCADRAFT_45319 [Tortispora caseinolytica NRRL Y-17796]|uniref:RRM domain-containing protein n=1 Tax=Tortispora caseinolytica NRRL Y-17796 TaxID=767744 RepID=A0A1E4TAQ2_9ASCO|nr:hypothetical protein CANCADRAFT_45319 [Tortispora caseinolytica NRRL Y-17796]